MGRVKFPFRVTCSVSVLSLRIVVTARPLRTLHVGNYGNFAFAKGSAQLVSIA